MTTIRKKKLKVMHTHGWEYWVETQRWQVSSERDDAGMFLIMKWSLLSKH